MMTSAVRVAVTGYGALCSLGSDAQSIWHAICDRRIGYARSELPDARIRARFFGFLDGNGLLSAPPSGGGVTVNKALWRQLAPFARMALRASAEAMTHAGGLAPVLSHHGALACGVIIGTGWGGIDAANTHSAQYRKSGLASPFSSLMSMPSAATAAVSQALGLRGYQTTPVAACASGAIAIGEAAEVIRRGAARCMLAGGTESLKELFNIWSIDILDALSKEQEDAQRACCPFSLDRSGFVLSEGAAVLCLEEWEAAQRRGARILGEVAGYGNHSDAYDLTAPAPDREARVAAIDAALAQAGLATTQIDYINAHGTSTPLNDEDESEAIKRSFGDQAPHIPISSTKSYTGHLIGAAGAMESILCLQAMDAQMAPATLHLRRPDPRCDLDYTPNEHRALPRMDACLNLSFGFGGANAALVLTRTRS